VSEVWCRVKSHARMCCYDLRGKHTQTETATASASRQTASTMPRRQTSIIDSRSQSNAVDSVARKSIRPEDAALISTESTGDASAASHRSLSSRTASASRSLHRHSAVMATKHCGSVHEIIGMPVLPSSTWSLSYELSKTREYILNR